MSLQRSPPAKGLQQGSEVTSESGHGDVPHGIASSLEPLIDMAPLFNDNTIESVTACKIPLFWKQQPALWFAQIESLFQIHRIRSDDGRYHLVIGALDSEAIQEIADILASPPAIDKYVTLKTQLLARFADSADKQLHRLLTDLELGNRKPSQLLRHMRTLAGNRVSQDILRVRWLALLPPGIQRVLKILRTTCLDELSTVADELMDGSSAPQVLAVASSRAHSLPPVQVRPPATENQDIQRLGEIITSMQQTVANLTALFERFSPLVAYQRQSFQRQRSRSRSRSRANTVQQTSRQLCYYHRRFGAAARQCQQPCSYTLPTHADSAGN